MVQTAGMGDRPDLRGSIGAIVDPPGTVNQTINQPTIVQQQYVTQQVVAALEKPIDPRVGAIGPAERAAIATDFSAVGWTDATLSRAYRAARRQLAVAELADFARAEANALLAEMLADLLSRTAGKQWPLLEFLGRLAKSEEAAEVHDVLVERVNTTARAFNLSDEDLENLWTQVVSEPAHAVGTRPVLLVVLHPSGKPKSPDFSLQAVLITDEYRRTIRTVDTARPRKAVVDEIAGLLRAIDASEEFGQERPLVAFCLPRQLWGSGVDQWEMNLAQGIPIEIGLEYPVVLCSQERIAGADPGVSLATWKERWERLGVRPPLVSWLERPEDCHDLKSYLLRLRGSNVACLALTIPPPQPRKGKADLFQVVLLSGTPIIVWVRGRDCAAPDVQAVLKALLANGLEALPDELLRQRTQARNAGLWPRIVLIWDRPDLRPSRLRLRPPDG